MNTNETSLNRPGYWFGVIEYGLREKMREAFHDLDLSRGEWRILHTLADGPKSVDEVEAALPPGERHRRMGGRMFGGPARGYGPWFGPGFGPWGGPWAGPWAGRGFGYGPWAGRGYGPWFARGFAEQPGAHAEHHGHPEGSEPHDHPEPHGDPEQAEHHEHHGHPEEAEHHEHHEHHGHPEEAEHHEHHGHPGHHGHACSYGHGDSADRGERRRPRSVAEVLVSFTERGWVVLADGAATLTDAGRAIHDDAQSRVTELRASVTEGISDEEYRALLATLEKMARNVGWTDAAASEDDEAEEKEPEAEPEADLPETDEPESDDPGPKPGA